MVVGIAAVVCREWSADGKVAMLLVLNAGLDIGSSSRECCVEGFGCEQHAACVM